MKDKIILVLMIITIGILSVSSVASADYDGFSIELEDNDHLNFIITFKDIFDVYSNDYSNLYVVYCNLSDFKDIDLEKIAKDKLEDFGFGNLKNEDDMFIAENINSSLVDFKYVVVCNSSDSAVLLAGDDLDKLKELAKTVKFKG